MQRKSFVGLLSSLKVNKICTKQILLSWGKGHNAENAMLSQRRTDKVPNFFVVVIMPK